MNVGRESSYDPKQGGPAVVRGVLALCEVHDVLTTVGSTRRPDPVVMMLDCPWHRLTRTLRAREQTGRAAEGRLPIGPEKPVDTGGDGAGRPACGVSARVMR